MRNVELTAPYFHNGGQATLRQVVEFYNRGGDFADVNQANLDPNIQPLFLTDDQKDDLNVGNGGSGTTSILYGAEVMDDRVEIAAVGATGNGTGLGTDHTPLANFLQSLVP